MVSKRELQPWEDVMKTKAVVIWFLVLLFSFTTTLALAAGESYVVIKDKNGVCKIIKAQEKTPKTVAGPFKTKEEAEKAKKECAKDETKPAKPEKKEPRKK
jgi:hypothetical protein